MSRPRLEKLRVSGPGKPPAELDFGPGLTFITGFSNTGKSHILECVDYALGAGTKPREIPESKGYNEVALQLGHGEESRTIIRRLADTDDIVTLVEGPLDEWDGKAGDTLKVSIVPGKAAETLSGTLLTLSGFDPELPVVKNQRGQTQSLSFRTVSPFVLIAEPDVISPNSPILPPSQTQQTAARSVFRILLTGTAPTAEEIDALKQAHDNQERAKHQVAVLQELIADLRAEIEEAQLARRDLEDEVARIDDELATVSESVSKSGEHVRHLLKARNEALNDADAARREYLEVSELGERFSLLGKHYESDFRRLEFVLEGGHFFQQIAASHCPTCGRPLESDEDCHPESADFADITRAAKAEIKKLQPRLEDLSTARSEATQSADLARARWERHRRKADDLDSEIKQVANPSAASARARVKEITQRRQVIEDHLTRFRELDRYNAALLSANATAKRKVDHYRPHQTTPSLASLARHVQTLLEQWKFPITADVSFSLDTDDLVIDGKDRKANGKGVRAVTHAAFTIGLMRYAFEKDTPHPGFVVIDTPLTHFKGPTDEVEDPALTRNLHTAFLHALTTSENAGQAIIIENIDPPAMIRGRGTIHEFSGPDGAGRRGFYPATSGS